MGGSGGSEKIKPRSEKARILSAVGFFWRAGKLRALSPMSAGEVYLKHLETRVVLTPRVDDRGYRFYTVSSLNGIVKGVVFNVPYFSVD